MGAENNGAVLKRDPAIHEEYYSGIYLVRALLRSQAAAAGPIASRERISQHLSVQCSEIPQTQIDRLSSYWFSQAIKKVTCTINFSKAALITRRIVSGHMR
jgi:hypothetical protein